MEAGKKRISMARDYKYQYFPKQRVNIGLCQPCPNKSTRVNLVPINQDFYIQNFNVHHINPLPRQVWVVFFNRKVFLTNMLNNSKNLMPRITEVPDPPELQVDYFKRYRISSYCFSKFRCMHINDTNTLA